MDSVCNSNSLENSKLYDMEALLAERNLPAFLPREDMLNILLEEEYGRIPDTVYELTWKVTEEGKRENFSNFCAGKAYLNKVEITISMNGKSYCFPISVVIPSTKGRHPFIIHPNFRSDVPDKCMPTEEIVDNGFAVISMCYTDITSDDGDFTNGLAGIIFPDGKRAPNEAGKIAIWAWAMQRVMDYAETLDTLDKDCAVICGHSRLGKTALLTCATDRRFKFCYSNDSGCCGAAITREKAGEDIEFICNTFPFWFCENFLKYKDGNIHMPFDQHYLLALAAPAYVLVGSAEKDIWADPVSEMLSCVAADTYNKAIGEDGFVYNGKMAVPGEKYLDGKIGYHLRKGFHYFSREDWNSLFEFVKIHHGNK